MEFIINNLIKVHPMALLHPERVSAEDNRRIRELTQGHASPADYFVELLSRGIAKLAAPYHPHPAIVRLSDFKTNEYSHLIGGHAFEPEEENPMLGFRGASRYYDERYREGFALECRGVEAGSRRAWLHQCHRHGAVLPDPGGSGQGDRRHGRERPAARRERSAGLHDVRDPIQRHTGR